MAPPRTSVGRSTEPPMWIAHTMIVLFDAYCWADDFRGAAHVPLYLPVGSGSVTVTEPPGLGGTWG